MGKKFLIDLHKCVLFRDFSNTHKSSEILCGICHLKEASFSVHQRTIELSSENAPSKYYCFIKIALQLPRTSVLCWMSKQRMECLAKSLVGEALNSAVFGMIKWLVFWLEFS